MDWSRAPILYGRGRDQTEFRCCDITVDDILAIPGNKPVYDRLRQLLDELKAIAFAGAIGSGLPTNAITTRFSTRHSRTNRRSSPQPTTRWSAATSKRGSPPITTRGSAKLAESADPSARELTSRSREISEHECSLSYMARCEWMLGWVDVVEAKWLSAHTHLDQAKAPFTRSHAIQELARVHLTRAACHFGEGHSDLALAYCERALVLRARIALANGDPTTARNEAESAPQLAAFCEYAWAERDACED
jgi:hypothetical protein